MGNIVGTPEMRRPETMHRDGFTLVEMVLVIVVLAILAGVVVSLLGDLAISTPDGEKTPQQIATEQTMRQVRNAILGSKSQAGMWPDLGQRPELFPTDPNIVLVETAPSGVPPHLQSFDPLTGLGWRGPYLAGPTQLIDAWGNPLVIQIPDFDSDGKLEDDDVRYARLVSAGEDGVLDTTASDGWIPGDDNPSTEIGLKECGDDLLLFFRVPDTRL